MKTQTTLLRLALLTLVLAAVNGPSRHAVAGEKAAWIDPMIGTGGIGYGVGSILPGATRPFGMVKLSPDTSTGALDPDFSHCAGYWYYDTSIRGFTHNHLSGTGASDQGNILVVPTLSMSNRQTRESGYRQNFSHENENASAGYYSVLLDDTQILAELTATDRVGVHRYTFPASNSATIIIDASAIIADNSSSDVVVQLLPSDREIVGSMINYGSLSRRYGGQQIFFSAKFKRGFDRYGTFAGGQTQPEDEYEAGDSEIGAYVQFVTTEGEQIELAVGISYVSIEQARLNRETEASDWDFDTVRAEAEAAWETAFSVIDLEGGTDEQLRLFYSALYHSMMMPTLYTDVDGQYMGFDLAPHIADGFTYYTDFSLWDTFRTAHSLYNLILPSEQNDFIQSMLRMYEQDGYIDRWPQGNGPTGCMIGDSPAIVISEAYRKGVRDYDVDLAYEALNRYGTWADDGPHRPDLAEYSELGYVPVETGGRATSESLEYAYNDGALAYFAQALGKETDAAAFADRSLSYRNHWNPKTGFLQGRHEDGSFVEGFLAYAYMEDYAEGNAYQWSWYAPHDVAGLIGLFGGSSQFEGRLDEFFERSEGSQDTLFPDRNYWHGNEPDIHTPYLFHFVGRPDKSQQWARWVLETKYDTTPDGLDGNDDGGTLSAWYVLSALGLYPFAGTDFYLIGSPLFSRATLHLPGGNLTIIAHDTSETNLYVQSASWNGAPLEQSWMRHETLVNGGVLELQMGPTSSGWAGAGDSPPSLSTDFDLCR